MTLRVKIENTEPGANYNAVVRKFYHGVGLNGEQVDHGFHPPQVVKPGESLEVWISSGQSFRVDEEPVLGTPKV